MKTLCMKKIYFSLIWQKLGEGGITIYCTNEKYSTRTICIYVVAE